MKNSYQYNKILNLIIVEIKKTLQYHKNKIHYSGSQLFGNSENVITVPELHTKKPFAKDSII